MKIEKTTVLDGYYASGDYECFCFDTHPNLEIHNKETQYLWEKMINPADTFCLENHPSGCLCFLMLEDNREPIDPDQCRVYPGALLPDCQGKKGKWTITVTFDEDENS